MKVLFVINQLFRGGAETALVNLLLAMPPEKYEIDLMVYDQIDLPDTVSLIPKIPSYVRVHNVAQNEKKLAYVKKAIFKIYNNFTKRTAFRKGAYKVLKENEYDVAISFGEWFSPSLVAKHAKARWKYVWIHSDACQNGLFHPDLERLHNAFDGFIFVSNNSKLSAENYCPFMKGRSHIVNNMISDTEILEKSELMPDVDIPSDALPRLVTVANIRPEKNHLRQVRVMKKLFDEGLRFYWLNVGSQANSSVFSKIPSEIKAAGLQDYFLFTGVTENPYSAMKRADAVCVLSDHESWSMVITEAKSLGTPVIATKTSGALEQIVHGETGILCDFDDGDIAEKIKEFLQNPSLKSSIRKNLAGFSSTKGAMHQLEKLLTDEKKLLYVFDDINYMSGARAASLLQAEYLRQSFHVDLFSATAPKDEALASDYRIINIENNKKFKCLSVPTREVLKSAEYSKKVKLLRILYTILVRLGMDTPLYKKLLKRELSAVFNTYDAIIVVSEASKLRHFVSTLKNPKKIQWIHTDYVAWRKHSNWTKKITSHDKKYYKKYDKIVCLSETLRDKFAAFHPSLANKTVAIPNLIDYGTIIKNSLEKTDFEPDKSKLNLITIGRMEEEKRYDSILSLAKDLKECGTDFSWYLVGDGILLEKYKKTCQEMNLSDKVIFTGHLKNACPLLKKCDLFVLLSEYEGTPVTIDEAKVLGIPVLAKNVGGIKDQLNGGEFGEIFSTITFDTIISFSTKQTKNIQSFNFHEFNNSVISNCTKLLEDT